MKVVINTDYGGFGLSEKAWEKYLELKGIEWDATDRLIFGSKSKSYYYKGHAGDDDYYIAEWTLCEDRSDPDLVKIVEEMMDDANGWASSLKVVEIPDGIEWYIHDYDGVEVVHEKHRSWS